MKKSIRPIIIGILIFVFSEIFGIGIELLSVIMFDFRYGINFPVPYHLHTTAFLLTKLENITTYLEGSPINQL